jgi:hypothetical protein
VGCETSGAFTEAETCSAKSSTEAETSDGTFTITAGGSKTETGDSLGGFVGGIA